MTQQMQQVLFCTIPVGTQFKETPEGAWYLKTTRNSGTFRNNGVESEPQFDLDETVFVKA